MEDKKSDSLTHSEEVVGVNTEPDTKTSEVRASSREKRMTEKGLEFKIDTAQKAFKSALTSWRRQAINVEILLADSDDVDEIRTQRKLLMGIMHTANSSLDKVLELQTSENTDSDLRGKLEVVEEDHYLLMKRITKRLHTLEGGKSETDSVTSRQSHRSHASQVSNASRKSKAAADVAELKTKLKYVDAESKIKLELEKLETMKRLEMAEAKVQVYDELQRSEQWFEEQNTELGLHKDSKEKFVEDFVTNASQLTTPNVVPVKGKTEPVATEFSDSQLHHIGEGHVRRHNFDLNPEAQEFNRPDRNARDTFSSQDVVGAGMTTDTRMLREGPPPVTTEAYSMQQMMSGLIEHLAASRLPPPEPGVFTGEPLQYASWKTAFATLIENKKIATSEKIYYLKRYLGGKARECVEGYFLLNTEDAYFEARKKLERRFGDPFVLGRAFLDKLDKWTKISPRDGVGLRKFSDFLCQCEAAMKGISTLNALQDDRELQKLQQKLPDWMANSWARTVYDHKQKYGRSPPFSTFVSFVVREADIMCDPATSIHQAMNIAATRSRNDTESRARHVLVSGTSSGDQNQTETGVKKWPCIVCNGQHHISKCTSFLNKLMDERWKLVKERRLCFSCLNPKHMVKNCRSNLRCNKCNRRHSMLLHRDEPATKNSESTPECESDSPKRVSAHSMAVHYSEDSECSRTSMIVPVYVSQGDNTEEETLTYALLDPQSDTTFVSDDMCEQLKVTGPVVQLVLSTMSSKNELVTTRKISDLYVRGYRATERIKLPSAYTSSGIPTDRDQIPTPDTAKKWAHLEKLVEELIPLQRVDVGLLIGYNCTQALIPREVIPPPADEPFGQRTSLGWGIVGVTGIEVPTRSTCHRMSAHPESATPVRRRASVVQQSRCKEVFTPADLARLMDQETNAQHEADERKCSYEDRVFIQQLERGIHETEDGHYEMPLPFKDKHPVIPNNKQMAVKRLQQLKGRMSRDSAYHQDYTAFMKNILNRGYAERVPQNAEPPKGGVSYIPHHGVYSDKKPGKIRVVFDCSARYKGVSLNDILLQGPDMINALLGVLCRFRKEPVAITCDIEQMFFQFRVDEHQRDFLRFLWWEQGDYSREPTEYRMTVHTFGAISSPACANFGLKRAADDGEEEFGTIVADFVRSDFYVDDGLTSVPSVGEAKHLVCKTKELCAKHGLRLHKFSSNSQEVLESIPPEDRAKGLQNLDLTRRDSVIERTLGIEWCIQRDCFQFKIALKERPLTRRGILSAVSALYDPLGFLAPVILVGKLILQDVCREQLDWDSTLPDVIIKRWERWQRDLVHIEVLKIDRCFQPADFGEVKSVQLHHFGDASTVGYGQCTYLRLENTEGHIHCCLVMSKARVAPVKQMTIPRLELSAAVLSVKASKFLQRELRYNNIEEFFWTDSEVVLGYISNDAKRFHVFVSNRVQQIRDQSTPDQWNHVKTKENPADYTSRGLTTEELVERKEWLHGPSFLWEAELPQNRVTASISTDDPEVKRCQTFVSTSTVSQGLNLQHLEYFSDWYQAKRAVANCLRYKRILTQRINRNDDKCSTSTTAPMDSQVTQSVDVELLCDAEHEILKSVQWQYFGEELGALTSRQSTASSDGDSTCKVRLKRTSALYPLDPFLDEYGLIRVGGRIGKASVTESVKHPVILPKVGHITEMIVRHFHEKTNHQGRGITVNEIRSSGFWIVGCRSVASSYIHKCVICRRVRGTFQTQKMASLPEDRTEPAAPFSYCAVDYFGPFHIREKRSDVLRYGVLFTCMVSRAIHLETANSLGTDAFINALRRFIAVRGPIRQLRCDRGTNFVGAKNEMNKEMASMDHEKVGKFLLKNNCDFFEFKMNVPSASHMGGIWERQIRTVRNVLVPMLDQTGSQLDDESLRTLFCEVMAIVNNRPLSVDNLYDVSSTEPLTPNHLLTMKTRVVLPPPGEFQHADVYSQKRWRRVQYLLNVFWSRWRQEYLQTFQVRRKWNTATREMKKGDIVIIKDENQPRGCWRLAAVDETFPSDDGHVRKVRLRVADTNIDRKGKRTKDVSYLERPVHKLVLLLEAGN